MSDDRNELMRVSRRVSRLERVVNALVDIIKDSNLASSIPEECREILDEIER